MKLSLLFVIFLILQIPACAALMWMSYRSNIWIFYGTELLFIIILIFDIFFYRKVLHPIVTLTRALDMLKGNEINSRFRMTGQPEVDTLVEVFNGMMEKLHRKEVLIREQTHFLSLLAQAAPVGILVCGIDGRIILANSAANNLIGAYEGHELPQMLADMEVDAEKTFRLDHNHVLRCFRRRFMQEGVNHTFYIIDNMTDIVAAAEKRAYGKLIRLLAHEVNNTVAGLAVALETVDASGDDAELLAECRHRAMQLSAFVGRFADVIRTPAPTLRLESTVELVTSQKRFLESLCLPRQIILDFDIKDNDYVEADAVQISQVLVNVVKNACESIGSGGNVTITVEGKNITVADNGKGIPPKKRPTFSRLSSPTSPEAKELVSLLYAKSFPLMLVISHCLRIPTLSHVSEYISPDKFTHFSRPLPSFLSICFVNRKI